MNARILSYCRALELGNDLEHFITPRFHKMIPILFVIL